MNSRRRFLRFLAASPLLPYLNLPSEWTAAAEAIQEEELIKSAKDAINVFDFEPVARKKLPPAHWGYLAGGTDDDLTIQANREGFTHFQLRARRLVDVKTIDMSTSVFGAKWETPILLCPIGSQRAFHADGELAVARAVRGRRHMQVLSTVATSSIEDVNAARGEPVWFQLYQQNDWRLTRQLVKRAEAAGCPALVFTVDQAPGVDWANRETIERARRRDTRDCTVCHVNGQARSDHRRRPMMSALDRSGAATPEVATPTWEFIKRLKDTTPMKVVVKGIVTREDAELAMQHGVDAIYVSNHGGRSDETLRSTIDCVPEIVAAAGGRAPIVVDSGFRRGTDIFKALALGATAVGIGRPYVWGLAAFGQEGVEAVLDILRKELLVTMRQIGTPKVEQITKAFVIERR